MNFAMIMKQAQQAQAKVGAVQEEMANTEFTGTAGGGAVTVVVTGKGDTRSVKLAKSVVNAEEVDILEDLIVAALNDAHTKSTAATAAAMKDAMGGLNLPAGIKLPF